MTVELSTGWLASISQFLVHLQGLPYLVPSCHVPHAHDLRFRPFPPHLCVLKRCITLYTSAARNDRFITCFSVLWHVFQVSTQATPLMFEKSLKVNTRLGNQLRQRWQQSNLGASHSWFLVSGQTPPPQPSQNFYSFVQKRPNLVSQPMHPSDIPCRRYSALAVIVAWSFLGPADAQCFPRGCCFARGGG